MPLKKTFSSKFFWIVLICVSITTVALKTRSFTNSNPMRLVSSSSCDCYSSSSLFNVVINFNSIVAGDLQSFNVQSQADCFAWKEFISLNWPSDSTVSFGTPCNLSPVQWETFMPREVLFQPGGIAPPTWGTLVSERYVKNFKSQKLLLNKTSTKLLTFTSKIEDNDPMVNFSANQAAPQGKPAWLGAQNGSNVWYEIMLNKDYYDYVVNKGFYNAQAQHDSVNKNVPLIFPQGVYQGKTGAIELKAAWMEVSDPQSAKWNRYKLSKATVLDQGSKQLRNTVVALVGLHILHKTQNQPTWVWATFEQIDNVPSPSVASPPYGYNFNNSNCISQQVKIKTAGGDTLVNVPCTPNTSPPYYLNQANPVPIQIIRTNAIDATDAAPINTKMQNNIRLFYPNSVWQYYQLVDVIWSQTPQPDASTPIKIPRKLNASAMRPISIVANATLETYIQSKTCFNCHVYSTIAPLPSDSANNNIFGDFSFAIKFAKYPGSSKLRYKQNIRH